MTGNTCCLCWDSSVCDPGWQCLPFPLCQNQTQLPNVSSASPQASCRCCPLSRSLGAALTHPSFPSGLALPFVCFSQVSLECVQGSAVCFGRDQTIPNPPSRNPALIFSSLLTGWGLATGKGNNREGRNDSREGRCGFGGCLFSPLESFNSRAKISWSVWVVLEGGREVREGNCSNVQKLIYSDVKLSVR